MPYRRFLATLPQRPARMWPAVAFLLAAVALFGERRAAADLFPRDPVADFRQALLEDKDIRDKEAVNFRRDNLTRKARALTSLGEMARVLLLQEWRVDVAGEQVAEIDRDIRDGIADRFVNGLKEVLASGDPARTKAAAVLMSETASATRTLAFKGSFLRDRLRGLAPELAKVATTAEPGVQRFAAEALGNIQGEPAVVVPALQSLVKSGTPAVRRAAADALGNVVQVVSQQEKKVRGGDIGRLELRRDLLKTGLEVVPAAQFGLVASQPVEVRRLSADALQQVSAALVDLSPDPIASDRYPPPGRPWTDTEAKAVEGDREILAETREQLRPLLETFAKESSRLGTSSGDPDPYVRIQIRQVLEDVTATRTRLRRAEASIPRGETVPAPRPEAKPAEKREQPPKSGGVFLPPAVTPSGVPVWLVGDEKDKPGAASAGSGVPGAAILSTLPAVVAGLSDPNVRARIGAVEVLETMGTDAVPAIPALVKSLSDPDRFVRWAAVRTLGRLAPREANLVVPAAARLLEDADLDVAVAAATALERYGPQATDAVAALARRVTHGDAEIRVAAMRVLVAIGSDAAPALPAVAFNLAPQQGAFSTDFDLLQPGRTTPGAERAALSAAASLMGAPQPARIRVMAAETLGRFGKLAEAAVPALQQSLGDTDPEVRRAASEALLRITGK